MQHEFTDAQILYAADDATEETTSSYKAVGLPYLRAFLDALPDQPDDWQECTFDEIRKGDRVRIVTENFYTVYDHPVLEVGQTSICSTILFACGTRAFLDDYNTLYRIPAPVEHPDPEVDRVVVMHGWTRGYTEQCKPTKSIAMLYDGANYVGYDDGSGERLSLAPENITDWTPVDVVPKVVADE